MSTWYKLAILVLIFSTNISLAGGNRGDYDPFYEDFIALRESHRENKNLPQDASIEKIIHQFWIGPHKLPDPYQYMIDSCKLDGFEHKMWTNANYESLLDDSDEYRKVFNKIPAHDWAVKKDYLSYLALKKFGGAAVDVSVFCSQNMNFLHEHYSSYYAYQSNIYEQSNHVSFLLATFLGMKKDSPIIHDVINRFAYFIDNYHEYNTKYSSKDASYDVHLYHGWMGQVTLNESLHHYCFQGKNNAMCDDAYILLPEDHFPSYAQYRTKANIKFIDMEIVPSAHLIKSFYTKVIDIYSLLGIQ